MYDTDANGIPIASLYDTDANGIPIVPDSLRQYDSYTVDPRYARIFTYVWVAAVAFCCILAFPRFIRSARSGRLWSTWQGISYDSNFQVPYESLSGSEGSEKALMSVSELESRRAALPKQKSSVIRGWLSMLSTWSLYSPPKLRLDVGQLLVLGGYLATLLVCMLYDAQLRTNANRAGFMALAQLPLLFLLSTKNSILAALLGRGYEKLNFLHRWSGRAVFLSATIHGSLWINNHIKLKASLKEEKEMRGIFAYTILCIMILTSLRPVRNLAYQFFFVSHIVGFVTFFILVCHHTPYAQPWIFPPVAFYAFDMLLRFLRFRFKTATLTAPDKMITFMNVEGCDFGWVAGQHIRVRLLYSGRVFESHPLTICNAPATISNIRSSAGQLLLAARVNGDWTRAINQLAHASNADDTCCGEKSEPNPVVVMLDGPYGGVSFDLGRYEHVLLVAGGAGITFILGVLDDLVGKIAKLGRRSGERTTKIEFAWCIKSFGCIHWFTSQLQDIASAAAREPSLELHMKFFVTCLCDPEAVPAIANSEVTILKPSIAGLLQQFVTGAEQGTGGIGVVTCGPESLVAEARNSVAALGTRAARLGGVALHTEVFCL